MRQPAPSAASRASGSGSPRRRWLRSPWLPIALHVVLCLGIYQSGLSRAEMAKLRIEGPSHLIDAYIKAARVFGPLGVIRAYLRGESDERLYLEYSRLLLLGRTHIDYIAQRQNEPTSPRALPARAWPYRDVRVEYPPFAFLAMTPPALISTQYYGYRRAFAAYMLLLQLLNVWLALRLLTPGASRSTRLEPHVTLRALYGSLAFMLALGTLVVTRMDHLVTTVTLVSLLAFRRASETEGAQATRWAALCGALVAIGVMTKLVPGLAGVVAVLLLWQQGTSQRLARVLACTATGALCLLALNLGMYALAGDGYLDTFRYHALRGVQIESSYAGVLMILHQLTGFPLHVEESFGSTNLASSATQLVKNISPWLFLVLAGYLGLRRRFAVDGRGALVWTCGLLMLFMLTNRVFSPQYLIWIGAPVCALAAQQPRRRVLWGTFLFTVLVSQLIFPRGYSLFKALHPLATVLLNVRNLSLALFCAGLLRAYSVPRTSTSPAEAAAT